MTIATPTWIDHPELEPEPWVKEATTRELVVAAREQIIEDQNRALGKAFAALSNVRDWTHHHYLGDCTIGGTTMAKLLDEAIAALSP